MGAVERVQALPLEEFVRLYDQEGPFEYIDGERVAVSPTVSGHNVTARTLLLALHPYAVANQLGEAFVETPFVLSDTPNWVTSSRVPDIMFFTAERLSAYKASTPDWQDKPFILVPDLVAEVVSPTDRYSDVLEKVARYLNDGVRVVWVVNRQLRNVVVHKAGSKQQTTLQAGDTLDGGEIIPGFTLSLASLFE
jgi:Uma2 family endonuclease